MAAELGSYKQAHTSSTPPLTLGNSRVVEGPAPLKEAGFQSPSYAWRVLVQGLGRRGPPPRLLPKPHCTGPSWTFLRVVVSLLLEGGPTSPFRAEPGWVPWAKTRPPGARLRAPTPGLAPGWGPRPGPGGKNSGLSWRQPLNPVVDTGSQASRSPGRSWRQKLRVWEEFGEAMEVDYRSASKRFWQTVRRLRRGKQYSANTVYSAGGELLTSTERHCRTKSLR
ncbi:hypothetical protein L3Q82_017872 [Scortum barcoo]|uniref:Uncharacterized protein n=1 Tax=Scortum barcoo TaxID=214431 RepID=A0ACB8VHW1_9TELE|nr:hypothetical protein L3Q82_017872 [Scortum barcoo]